MQSNNNTTTINAPVNSKKYWDHRFLNNWEEMKGREQSTFFYKLAINNFPEWFIRRTKTFKLSICDWGCAQGEGTDLLANTFELSDVVGVDFSSAAIEKAQSQFPNRSFACVDLTTNNSPTSKYDILLSSNTLEHFREPWKTFKQLGKHASKFIVLLLPFREYNRKAEHFVTFDFSTINLEQGDWTLVHSAVIDAGAEQPSSWNGEQVLLIYTYVNYLSKLNLSLSEIAIHTAQNSPLRLIEQINELEIRIADRSQKEADLAKELENREQQLKDKRHALREVAALLEKSNSVIAALEKDTVVSTQAIEEFRQQQRGKEQQIAELQRDNTRLNSALYQRNQEYDGLYKLKLVRLSRFLTRVKVRIYNIGSIRFLRRLGGSIFRAQLTIITTIKTLYLRLISNIKRQKLLELARLIPDSNGSSYYKKLDLNIAIITDEFMYNYYSDAVNLFYINSANYKEVFSCHKIDLCLFVSCWFGLHNNDWRGVADNEEVQSRVYKIFDKARQNKIPIVFQTIEDPSNYSVFLPIAKQADYIFTADQSIIEKYIQDTGNPNVHYLEYGVNPMIHNPIGIQENHKNHYTKNKIFFAGSWAKRYEERCIDARTIFSGIRKAKRQLIIADRNYGNQNYQYPTEFQKMVIPAIEHKLLQKVHKLFTWNINLNSIKTSPSMCAMRIYELQALGTLMLSNYAVSVYNRFPTVFLVHNNDEVKHIVNGYSNKELYELQVKGIRNIFSGNTVFERLDKIVQTAGIRKKALTEKRVVVVCKQKSKKIMEMFEKQTYISKSIVTEQEIMQKKLPKESQFVAFFDRQYSYGDYYLEDMVNGFKYTDVAFVTKDGHYKGELLCGSNHQYVEHTNDKYKSMFNLAKFNLSDVLAHRSFTAHGFSIDPFEVNEVHAAHNKLSKKISVIVPTYNNGEFLYGKAFLSLRRSTMFNDMHILLIDDGSDDLNTIRIINRLAARYPNVSTFFFPKGGSGSASRPRNKGVTLSTEPYVTFLDPDNEAVNNNYTHLYNLMRKNNKLDFAFGYCSKVFQTKITHWQSFNSDRFISAPSESLVEKKFFSQSVQACLISREFLLKNKIENVEGALGEDTLFFYELMLTANNAIYTNKCIHLYYADRIGSSVNYISINFFKKSLILETEQAKRLRRYNAFESYLQYKYLNFMRGWYVEKLTQIKPEELDEATSIVKNIASLYNKDIEINYQNYLHQIPDSNGSSFFKKLPFNIAIITDELAYEYYQSAATFHYINYDNFREILLTKTIDFVLFVSCWRGMKNNEWMGISHSESVKQKVYEIFDFAKSKNIKVVFQSKEDPPNYDVYINIAKQADYIFTTAQECIPKYIHDTGNSNVFLLEYGINPAIHNPVGSRIKNHLAFETVKHMLFAGSWYTQYPDRCKDQSLLFDGVLSSNRKLTIIDRNYFLSNPNFEYPHPYNMHTFPSVKYANLQKLHKLFDFALNFNIVKDSQTMFAARVYELQAMGNAIISNYSIGIEKKFPNIFMPTTAEEIATKLNSLTDIAVYKAQTTGVRNVFAKHTVYDQVTKLAEAIGIDVRNKPESTVFVVTKKKSMRIQRMFDAQSYEKRKLILLHEIKNYPNMKYVTFFDEKYIYGIHYLEDMVNGFKYTDVAYVTKGSFIANNEVKGIDHNYVLEYSDKFSSIFNLDKISLDSIINNRAVTAKGYSIDPFEIEISA